MRFLVDMPLSPQLAVWLKQNGHDAVHAVNMGMGCAPDEEILQRAKTEGSVVITADLDYPRLLALARSDRPGLILFRGGNYSEQESLDRLRRALETVPIEEIPSSVVVIEKKRIRLRRLPIKPD